jgi:hypothetical protein
MGYLQKALFQDVPHLFVIIQAQTITITADHVVFHEPVAVDKATEQSSAKDRNANQFRIGVEQFKDLHNPVIHRGGNNIFTDIAYADNFIE